MPRRFLLAAVTLAGCTSIQDTYAPPIQRKPLNPSEPRAFGHFVNMNDPNAEAYFVKDVSPNLEGGAWRWTGKRPELKFFLDSVDNLSFVMDYTIAEPTFTSTGPVNISIFINGQLLERLHEKTHGERHFSKPAPPALLRKKGVNVVAMEIDKVWVSPADRAVLGFVLTRAGFRQ